MGYASFSTDTGHNGTSADAAWALNQPERLIDFGWRAFHSSSLLTKQGNSYLATKTALILFCTQIVEHYYNVTDYKTYWLGCSTGGRQGLKAIQLYPEDYDAIVIGSPGKIHRVIRWAED